MSRPYTQPRYYDLNHVALDRESEIDKDEEEEDELDTDEDMNMDTESPPPDTRNSKSSKQRQPTIVTICNPLREDARIRNPHPTNFLVDDLEPVKVPYGVNDSKSKPLSTNYPFNINK